MINPHGSTWARGAGDDEPRIRQDAQVSVQLLLTGKIDLGISKI